MRKILNIFPLFLLVGCQLITEPDISGSKVYLLAPVDSLVTTTTTHTLWWEYVSDAEKFNLIIVSPSWDAVEVLVADTNLTGNKYFVTLPPGEYDWGVQAYNNSSATDYFVRHISIDTSSSLNNQLVVLRSPENNFSTNIQDILFEWFKLGAADSYIFDIRFDSWQGSSVIPQQVTTDDTLSVSLNEGVYYWGVKGINDFSSTVFSTHALYIDLTPPGKPIITFPQFNGDTISQDELKITWNRPITSISLITDSVFVSADSVFSEGSIQDYFITQNTEISLEGYSSGFYFTKVRSFDAAGNLGESSAIRKFFVDEE